jgi:hypothetical protein
VGRVRTRAYVTGLAAAVLAVSGCGSDKIKEAPSSSANLPPPKTTFTIPPPAAHPTRGRLPSAISATESSAEDLVDYARAKNRAKVVAGAEKLRNLAQGGAAQAALEKSKLPVGLIEGLAGRAQAIGQLAASAHFLEIALAANQVSGLMPNIYSYYSYSVPPSVLQLDYLDREAQFRSIANDLALTQGAIEKLASTWKELQPQVVKAGGAKEAGEYSRHVEAMRRLSQTFDRPAIRKEAAKGLVLVDELEGVFRR